MDEKDIVTSYESLYRAFKSAKRNKPYNGSCAKFQMMTLEGLHMLKEQLENQSYQMAPYNEFKIYEPKERVIESCSFKDKVVQHSLSDNILHPVLENEFIRTNYAGQKGKGTHFGMNCLKDHMMDFYRKHGLNGWILKCDITKFYYRINHDVVKDILEYHFCDTYTEWLNTLFVNSTEHLGLPLGNQVTQIYALLLLNGMDRMVTGELGIELYGRYADDFYLIHQDKEYLKTSLEHIEAMIESLGLELNGKTQIVPFKNGISFLGFHHYVTADGKYIRKIRGEKKRQIRKKLRRWVKAVQTGRMTMEKFNQKYGAWKNHALHGNCIKLCHSMDQYVEELFKGCNTGQKPKETIDV